MCSEAVVCLLESASRAEKAAEAVQQFVRRGFDVIIDNIVPGGGCETRAYTDNKRIIVIAIRSAQGGNC